MSRKSLIPIVLITSVIGLIVGIHECRHEAARMRETVERALEQNRNYIPFTSADTLHRVADYYDHPLHFWTTANERLRAYYALGSAYRDLHEAPVALLAWEQAIAAADTTAADCDFATLFRVYGQMASIYFRQYMPEKELEAQQKSNEYALQAGDTLNYIRGLLLRNDAYLALGDTAAIYQNIEHVRQLYLERGLKTEAAQVYPMAIKLAIEQANYKDAERMMHIFEHQSGLFDVNGNIVPTREIYYYNKGMYYLGINQPDSAEQQFRRLLKNDIDPVDSYRGLLTLYKQKHDADSIFKYARLYEDALGHYLEDTHIDAITQAEGMYDYSRQQRIAQEQQNKARQRGTAILLILILMAFGIVATFSYSKYMKRQKEQEVNRITMEYCHTLEQLDTAEKEMYSLQQTLSKKASIEKLLKKKNEQVADLRQLVAGLQKQLSSFPEASTDLNLRESEAIQHFRNISNPHLDEQRKTLINARAATFKEWKDLKETVRLAHPRFFLFLGEHHLSDLKLKVCILSRLGFDNQEMSTLADVSKGSISNARTSVARELFNLDSSKILNEYLAGI